MSGPTGRSRAAAVGPGPGCGVESPAAASRRAPGRRQVRGRGAGRWRRSTCGRLWHRCGWCTSGYLTDLLDFGANDRVYHSNYWLQPTVHRALRRWLDAGTATPGSRGTPLVQPGNATTTLPAIVDTDVVVVDAHLPLEQIRTMMHDRPTAYAIVVRWDNPMYPDGLHYALARAEVSDLLDDAAGAVSLAAAHLLNESDRSRVQSAGTIVHATPSTHVGASSTEPGQRAQGRTVVVSDGRPVGVIPNIRDIVFRANGGGSEPPSAPAPSRPPARRSAPVTEPVGRGARRGRRRVRGGPRPPAAEDVRDAATPTVEQFFRAEMPDTVAVGAEATVMVQVSGEELAGTTGSSEADARADVDVGRRISIQIIPRRNYEVVGDVHAEIDPVSADQAGAAPTLLLFTVRATDAGAGEIWVVAKQGPEALVTMELTSRVVAADADARVGRRVERAAVALSGEAPPPRHQLTIYDVEAGGRTAFLFDFRAESLDVIELEQSQPLLTDRVDYVTTMYKAIEDMWADTAGERLDFEQQLREYGASLFEFSRSRRSPSSSNRSVR